MSGRQLIRALSRLLEFLVAPGLCLDCGVSCDDSASLCRSCNDRLRLIRNPCLHCGQPNPVDGGVCPACLLNPPRWLKLTAPLEYLDPTREYLHRLKYEDALYFTEPLCRRCLAAFEHDAPLPEAILPVPLHPSRLVERGYNQAQEIASIWARELGIPVERGSLVRVRPTPNQAYLSAAQRQTNLRGAFAYRPRREYRHVAVVDDIVTTGATVDEITRTLHRAGVEQVEIWALARVYRR